ncbi:efflux transporter outer membrane subunit [Roseomonas elaeocarpi]|uniref:Efflux transporter outer membrane subunit n=1 Tax=Roseomonas elaeocarpi TaxID=907779 RepID=A0ABV6JVM5_9PROT
MTLLTSFRSALLLGTALALAACSVGPDFKPPVADAPGAYADAARANSPTITLQADPDPRWWTRFNDPVLTSFVERAIRGNLDLQQAVLRIAQARQSEAQARAAGLPSINANASYTRQQLGLRGILEDRDVFGQISRNGGSNSDTINDALNGLTQPVNLFQAGFDASWELDLFGRVRRSTEQANAQTQAQREAANDALVSLEAEVVQAYANVRGAQALAQSQRENVATAQGVLDLVQRQRRQGLVTELDVENQRSQLFNYQAQLPTYERQLRQAMNRLSLLLGQAPGFVDQELETGAPIPPTPPVVAVGVPASLARRRPDIRQAEARLHAATAGVGVAVARFYPDISLTGSLGTRAADFSYLTNWSSHFYALGPSISLPIFQGGSLTAGLRLARAQEAEAALAYRSTVLNALSEVDNNLVAYRTDRAQRDSLQQTVNASQTALGLARERYEHGLSSFIDVLDAQRTLVAARQQLLQATLTLTTDLVALYKSLGGGWEGDTLPTVTAIPPPGGGTPIESLSPDSIAGVDKPGRPVPLSPGVGPETPNAPAAPVATAPVPAMGTAIVPYPTR